MDAGHKTAEVSFTLPPSIAIDTIETITADLWRLPLLEGPVLRLDAAAVENISTPGLQLLIALDKTLQATGGSVSMKNHGAPVARAFTEAGLGTLLGRLTNTQEGA